MRKFVILLVAFVIAASSLALPNAKASGTEPILNVKLSYYLGEHKELTLKVKGKYILDQAADTVLSEGRIYTLKASGTTEVHLYEGSKKLASGSALALAPLKAGSFIYLNNFSYNGKFTFSNNNGVVKPVNSIFMEDYIKGVVPKEMYANWHVEALKSQAAAARTYAIRRQNYEIVDGTSNQAYGGYFWAQELDPTGTTYANARTAGQATAGEYITYNGAAIDAVYSSSNGGHTESNLDYWGTSQYPYLIAKPDEFDGLDAKINHTIQVRTQQIDASRLDLANPEAWWSKTIELDKEFTNKVKSKFLSATSPENYKIVDIEKIDFHTLTSGGRVKAGDLTFTYFDKNAAKDAEGKIVLKTAEKKNVSEADFSYLFGYKMKNIYIKEVSNQDGFFTIKGAGFGHGVGMSQHGAQNRAMNGQTYKNILSFYYPGTVLSKRYTTLADRNSMLASLKGWVIENGVRSYYDPATGTKVQSGWKLIDSKWYYFKDGAAQTGWVYYKYKWYFLDSNGKMMTGWAYDAGKWYYMNSEGIMQTGWIKDSNKWYYMQKSGAMHKGWLTDGGVKYFMKSDGSMATGWLKIGTSWYYFHSSGAMDTGWLKWNNQWYYMNTEGIMQTGWVKVGTKWYYMYSSGVMAANTTIDGYRLGSDGAWIQ
ncbi:SpoIID/LytB domain-containing protein [Mesobacillus selenatarsenatis]|uniref:SpoIID/LytB domain-containing protein n=1 Tax=Mesobacillus selenatarsenatis TaxID=388741 RepID=A0A846TGY8_9BACI|nr:SpoIID/LytB domain-containing protein [Mesobacillus selenatarsenatis]NKE04692.1 SpoIID/LytB domain-containing protein [Mesobacillus selenatarsenatis]